MTKKIELTLTEAEIILIKFALQDLYLKAEMLTTAEVGDERRFQLNLAPEGADKPDWFNVEQVAELGRMTYDLVDFKAKHAIEKGHFEWVD